jgi:hypothetical protein
MISNEWIDEAHGIHSTSRATPYVKYGLHTTRFGKNNSHTSRRSSKGTASKWHGCILK